MEWGTFNNKREGEVRIAWVDQWKGAAARAKSVLFLEVQQHAIMGFYVSFR